MAPALDEIKFSRSLFMKENGSPISFHMRPGFQRKLIQPVIERGGGRVSCKPSSEAIKLCSDSDSGGAGDVVRSQYVIDCAKANKLLDMASYRRSTPPEEDDLAPSHLITTNRAHMRGRRKYSPVDDKKIVSYLVNEERYSEARGKRVWQDMHLLEVTHHSMESMRSRYLKVILPNIKSYDFPPHWVSMLTGNTADAQPAPHDNRGEDMVPGERPGVSCQHTQSPASVCLSPTSTALLPSRSTHSRETLTDDMDSQSEDDFDLMLLNTAEDDRSRRTGSLSCLTQGPGHTSQVTLSSPKKRCEVDTEVLTKCLSKASPRKRQNVNTVGEVDTVSKVFLRKRQNVERGGEIETVSRASPRKRQNVEREGEIDTVSRASPRKRQNLERGEIDTVSRASPRKRQNVEREGEIDTVSRASPRKRQNVEREGEIDTVGRASPRKRQNVEREGEIDTVGRASPRKRQNVEREGEIDTVSRASPRKRQNVEREEEIDTVGRASPRKRQNVEREGEIDTVSRASPRKRQNVEREEAEKTSISSTPDSYDQKLLISGAKMIEQLTQAFPSSPNKQSTHRGSRTTSDLTSQKNKTDPALLGGQRRKQGKDPQGNEKKAGIKSLVNYLMKDSESTSHESSVSDTEEDTEEDYADPAQIQKVAAEFGLTSDEMKYVLYINSGQQCDAVHWIKFGCDTQGYPAWSEADDRTLEGTDQTSLAALQLKHGPHRILSRSIFLETASK